MKRDKKTEKEISKLIVCSHLCKNYKSCSKQPCLQVLKDTRTISSYFRGKIMQNLRKIRKKRYIDILKLAIIKIK